jgi:hypothetical protein
MANEPVGVEVLEKDILERAGVEQRDDLPITIDATWGANPDGTPRVFTAGEPHPLLPGHLIFAIFQNPSEIKVYSLAPQQNGASQAPPRNPAEAKARALEEMRSNPTRTTLVKTSRCSVTEIMVLDVFVESIAQDLIMLEIDTYGEPPEGEDEKKEPPKEPSPPGPKPQLVPPPAGS